MHRSPAFSPRDLTRHRPLAPKYAGYTAMDWAKFYGLIAGLWYVLAAAKVRYDNVFDGYQELDSTGQLWVVLITLPPLLFAIPVVLIFFWWIAGALVRYSKWQAAQAAQWRFFWMGVLLFYGTVLFDPLDVIHPQMSRKGMAPAPNLIEMLGNGEFFPPPVFQFQWGYFLLWFLFWFLVLALHWSYLSDGLREAWFYINRFRRYGVSILLGFRETARLAGSAPVTRDYPRVRPALPPVYRGIPRLNVERLTAAEAAALRAADASGALSSPPGQPEVLFVDLGVYDFSPALAGLRRADGSALLSFTDYWPLPETRREELVIPLGGGLPVGTRLAASARGDEPTTHEAAASRSHAGERVETPLRTGQALSLEDEDPDGASPLPTGGAA